MSGETGLLASVRRLLATLLEIGQVRLELIATELELEKLRLFDALLLAGVALLALAVGLLLLCFLIVVSVGDAYRLPTLAVLALAFIGGSLWGLQAARMRLRSPGTLLDATAAEFARDKAALLQRD